MLQRRRVSTLFVWQNISRDRTAQSRNLQVAEKGAGMATARALAEIRANIMEEIRQERQSEQDPESAILRAQKKKSNGVTESSSSKKVRYPYFCLLPSSLDLQVHALEQHKGGEYADVVDPKAYLRINYEKYNIKLRNKASAMLRSALIHLANLHTCTAYRGCRHS